MAGVGDSIAKDNARWSFGGNVAPNFDSHVERSVPLYRHGHNLVTNLGDFFIHDDSIVYDIGSSTGSLLISLAERNVGRHSVKFVGIDNEEEMVLHAKKSAADKGLKNIDFLCADALEYEYEKASFFVSYYTIQFVHPSVRQDLINRIYENLEWGGGFAFFEKVRAPDARFQDIASTLYTEFKLDNGFGPDEIIAKTRSLKGILEPFSTNGNTELLQRAGFVDLMTILKYVCFEGFVAIK